MEGTVSNTGSMTAKDTTVKGNFTSNGTFTSDKTHVANGGSMFWAVLPTWAIRLLTATSR